MSAHMKELVTVCYREGCKSRAVVEVFNTWNASQGVFCRPCGKALVVRSKRGEEKDREAANAQWKSAEDR